jgi:hypothetical protein
MDYKFLDKVCAQIISETRIEDGIIYIHPSFPFDSHCKEVYSLNKEETEYVWTKYKEGVSALIDKKEPSHQEKG